MKRHRQWVVNRFRLHGVVRSGLRALEFNAQNHIDHGVMVLSTVLLGRSMLVNRRSRTVKSSI